MSKQQPVLRLHFALLYCPTAAVLAMSFPFGAHATVSKLQTHVHHEHTGRQMWISLKHGTAV